MVNDRTKMIIGFYYKLLLFANIRKVPIDDYTFCIKNVYHKYLVQSLKTK